MKDPGGWAEIGERVRECRIAANMSQEQLASALRLDRTMIAKIEMGVRRVDALELAKLSTVLKVPLSHFLTPAPAVVSRRAELAEDGAADGTRQSYRMEFALTTWLADVRQLMESGEFTPPPIARFPGRITDIADARKAALWARQKIDLGAEPISSLMSVCEALGQLVAVVEVPGEGASLVEDEIAVAVVSDQGDPGRRRATAAHELGHLVVGDEYSSDVSVHTSRGDRELVVEAFAAELLLPAQALLARFEAREGAPRERLVVLAAHYRTSWSLTLRQAVAAGVIDKATAKELRQRNPTRAELMEAVGWAPQPDLERVRVPPAYAHAVVQAYLKGGITVSRAVELMRGQIEPADLPARDDTEPEL
ncbi:helix-turn-helix domain-containing protein [Nonomuraea sp. NPDC050383]|uniref:helix-turn-helix domain-containing protein n=1 Tax=Nonomuraea sp. NPDC050383 TaxID=3364362 RepID=UPI0037953AF2